MSSDENATPQQGWLPALPTTPTKMSGSEEMEPSSLLRSETMSKVQLYIPSEVAHATVEELGSLESCQFIDLNADVNPFQRTYVSEIRKLDEVERKLAYLTSQIESSDLSGAVRPYSETQHLLMHHQQSSRQLDQVEASLGEHEERVKQMTESYETLLKRMAELQEARHVLRETAAFFKQAMEGRGQRQHGREDSVDEDQAPLLESADVSSQTVGGADPAAHHQQGLELEFVAGTMDRARMPTFERVLWRVLRGNLYMNWAEIDEPLTDPSKPNQPKSEGVRKAVFIIFAHGEQLLEKIRKIADSLGGTLYPIDSAADKRNAALREVVARIQDLQTVLANTNATRKAELLTIAESISAWWGLVRKEKLIYHTMNGFQADAGRRTLVAEAWVPSRDIPSVQMALRRATELNSTAIPPILHELRNSKDPPTFHRVNKFTAGFQAIIDAYGIASYQEVNPGLFTVITFPFLFAVMFGDIGHGILVALAAAGFIMVEKKYPRGFGEEIMDTFFFGRYIILLMGIFAVYTGLIYNDIFSLNLRMFSSGWEYPEPPADGGVVEAQSTGGVYPFGLDPAWHGADNALIFTNSLKMKMSIIFGVIHMSVAICLQLPNHIHFNNKRFILAEWLPQILFMESIFGYLMFMIIYKWAVDWAAIGKNPPNLLNTLIFMVLSPGTVDPDNQLYAGQAFVQTVLLMLAGLCIPWMLCAKPYLLYKDQKDIKEAGYGQIDAARDIDLEEGEEDANGHSMESHGEGEKEDHHDFGEIVIHQVIHTIEFCLGCISNTASYLRLWALSLAHAQLSEVLWSMTISKTFGYSGITGIVIMFVGFAFWFILTIAILCVMEGLSAFLHALRLHWVESNGKHYEGAGVAFAPLTFEGIDEGFY